MIINENLIAISRYLKEEYSVNDDVRYMSVLIKNVLVNGIRGAKVNERVLSEEPLITFRHGTINAKIYDKPGTIHFQYYNFQDAECYRQYVDKVPYRIKNQYNFAHNVLDISIDAIGGKVKQNTFVDTIQHELEHAFQEDKRGESFSTTDKYAVIRSFRGDQHSLHKRLIGEFLYLTFRPEQDAYVNGLYALLVHNYNTVKLPTQDVLEGSDINGVLNRIAELKIYFQSHSMDKDLRSACTEMKKALGFGYSRLISLAHEATDRINKKIGNVIYKAQKDTKYYNDMDFQSFNVF